MTVKGSWVTSGLFPVKTAAQFFGLKTDFKEKLFFKSKALKCSWGLNFEIYAQERRPEALTLHSFSTNKIHDFKAKFAISCLNCEIRCTLNQRKAEDFLRWHAWLI